MFYHFISDDTGHLTDVGDKILIQLPSPSLQDILQLQTIPTISEVPACCKNLFVKDKNPNNENKSRLVERLINKKKDK